jgi:hypothetical protein
MAIARSIAAGACAAAGTVTLVLAGAGSASAQSPGGADLDEECRYQYGSAYRALAHPDGVKCGISFPEPAKYPDFGQACDLQYGQDWFPVDRRETGFGVDYIRPINCARWIFVNGVWNYQEHWQH